MNEINTLEKLLKLVNENINYIESLDLYKDHHFNEELKDLLQMQTYIENKLKELCES